MSLWSMGAERYNAVSPRWQKPVQVPCHSHHSPVLSDLGTLHGTIKPKKGFQFLLVTAATFPGTVSHVDYKQFSLLSSCFPDQR